MKEIEQWRAAGKIAANVREELKPIIKRDESILKICEEGEEKIRELGGKPAFPINISSNHIAAHYTAPPNGKRKIPEGLTKCDVGAHKNGFIGDTAVTIPVGKTSDRIKEGLDAIDTILEYAISNVRAGIKVKKLSEEIHNKAHELGFGIIKDLNGHQILRGKLHGKITVSNVPSHFQKGVLKTGMILAIEPFIAVGREDGKTHSRRDLIPIYSVKEGKTSTNPFFNEIKERFGILPFAARWLLNEKRNKQLVLEKLSKLARKGLLEIYPVLEETKGRKVIHKEHTVLVRENSAEILTKRE